jgi:hypothetical protein
VSPLEGFTVVSAHVSDLCGVSLPRYVIKSGVIFIRQTKRKQFSGEASCVSRPSVEELQSSGLSW